METNKDRFAVFILTHGRPHKQVTYKSLRNCGYTGEVYFIIDNEDDSAAEYRELFGDRVIMFNKEKIAQKFDEADNFKDRRTIFYARNASFSIAKKLGLDYFLQLDDDYTGFWFKFSTSLRYVDRPVKNLDKVFAAVLKFYQRTPALSIAFGQGGDLVGGSNSTTANRVWLKRKAMNTFFCSTSRPFSFLGRVNEDVNTYVSLGNRGGLFFTLFNTTIIQLPTQHNKGGMTDIYLNQGTYVKSFYTVMYCPSAVKIYTMQGVTSRRIHHKIDWKRAVPCIVDEKYRKKDGELTIRKTDILSDKPTKLQYEFIEILSSLSIGDSRAVDNEIMRMAQPDYKSPLAEKWYKSLESSSPDYSIYDHDFYLSEAWACWAIYSRKYLRAIKLDNSMYDKSVISDIGKIDKIVDLGCGLGYTTAALAQMFEGSSVIGTNIEGSKQSRFVQALAEVYGFQLSYDLSNIDHADLVFASEYFEHFLDPIAHLREVIEKLSPRFLIIANSFGVVAPGHFINYIDKGKEISGDKISRQFNLALESLGYKKMKVQFWNNRPSYYKRVNTKDE